MPRPPRGAAATCLLVTAVLAGCSPSRLTPELVYFPQPPSAARVIHLKSFNRLHDLVPSRVTFVDALRGLPLGPYVATPAGLAYRDGHLYVCDTELAVVHDWDLRDGTARRIGQSEGIRLAKPVAVAVGADGTVYVADTDRGEVVAYPAEPGAVRPGRTLRIKPPGVEGYRPVAVAVSESHLYVADILRHRVDVFSVADGKYLESFGGVGSEPGKLYYPMGVALDDQGRIFVSDMMNARVQVLDGAGQAVLSMGQPGNRYGDMGKPRHLAVGPDGVVFVADAEFAHVHLFDPSGTLLMLLGGPGDKPGSTPMPIAVAVAEQLPLRLTKWVPDDFDTAYFLFVANNLGRTRISLFAVGKEKS